MTKNNYYIITGGLRSGKTTLINEFQKRNYKAISESGCSIIQDMKLIGAEAMLHEKKELYAELMLSRDLHAYAEAGKISGLVFFDRGIPDVIGFLKHNNLNVPEHLMRAAQVLRYNKTAFIAPPWKMIYTQDEERKQDWDEALRAYEIMHSVYKDLGYDLITLPCVSAAERVDFVLAMRRKLISPADLRRIRKHIAMKKVIVKKKVSQSGSIYLNFVNPAKPNYVIRISDHAMHPEHHLILAGRAVFNLGTHKSIDGDWQDCCNWIDKIIE